MADYSTDLEILKGEVSILNCLNLFIKDGDDPESGIRYTNNPKYGYDGCTVKYVQYDINNKYGLIESSVTNGFKHVALNIDKIVNILEKYPDSQFYFVHCPKQGEFNDIVNVVRTVVGIQDELNQVLPNGTYNIYDKDELQLLLPGIQLKKMCYSPDIILKNNNNVYIPTFGGILSKTCTSGNLFVVHPELLRIVQIEPWFFS
jgi:hypothetical protein